MLEQTQENSEKSEIPPKSEEDDDESKSGTTDESMEDDTPVKVEDRYADTNKLEGNRLL